MRVSGKQMTLSEIIRELKKADEEATVWFDFVYFKPDSLHSYRGYYEDLALGYSNEGSAPTVAEFLKLLEDANGSEFQGWKGGEYLMHDDTVVWVANPSESGGTAIVGVDVWRDSHSVTLRTEKVD